MVNGIGADELREILQEVLAGIAGDAYLPRRPAARYLGMSPRKLDQLPLERYRVGGMLYFRRSSLDRFMQAHVEQCRAKPERPAGLHELLREARKRALAEEKNNLTEGREE